MLNGAPVRPVAEINHPAGDRVTVTSSVPTRWPRRNTVNAAEPVWSAWPVASTPPGELTTACSPLVIVHAAIATLICLNHRFMTPQYRTIASGAAWLDASARGRLRFEGPDAASFLHALVTNDVTALTAGRGVYAAWLTPQGRMITDLRLLRDADALVAEVPEGLAQGLASRFDQLIFSENVQVSDVTKSTRQLVVFGDDAAQVVEDALAGIGATVPALSDLPILGHVTS